MRSPVLVASEESPEGTEVAQLIAEGMLRGRQKVWCPNWQGQNAVGWSSCTYGVPCLDLAGESLLRRLGWQSAYSTAVELFRRLCKPTAFNISRADTAVEYGVYDFERLRAKNLNLALKDTQLQIWQYFARRGGRRALRLGEQITDEGETYTVHWGTDTRVQAYHKRGEGVRIEVQVRRPRPPVARGQVPDPHAQVWYVIQQGAELFSALNLPFHREEPVVEVSRVTGEVTYDGIGTTKQKVATQFRRGVGLAKSVLRAEEDQALLAELEDFSLRVERVIAQRFPEKSASRWRNVEELLAHHAKEGAS